jgi:YgiT-type zinc finger domain-containing protein
MKCVICKNGETKPGSMVVPLSRGTTTIVFREVPAEVCENCGEGYVSEETTERLLRIGEEAAQSGVQVDVRQFLAA